MITLLALFIWGVLCPLTMGNNIFPQLMSMPNYLLPPQTISAMMPPIDPRMNLNTPNVGMQSSTMNPLLSSPMMGAGQSPSNKDPMISSSNLDGGTTNSNKNGLIQSSSSGQHTHSSSGHTHSSSGHTHSSSGHTHSSSGHTHSSSGHTHSSSGHTPSNGGGTTSSSSKGLPSTSGTLPSTSGTLPSISGGTTPSISGTPPSTTGGTTPSISGTTQGSGVPVLSPIDVAASAQPASPQVSLNRKFSIELPGVAMCDVEKKGNELSCTPEKQCYADHGLCFFNKEILNRFAGSCTVVIIDGTKQCLDSKFCHMKDSNCVAIPSKDTQQRASKESTSNVSSSKEKTKEVTNASPPSSQPKTPGSIAASGLEGNSNMNEQRPPVESSQEKQKTSGTPAVATLPAEKQGNPVAQTPNPPPGLPSSAGLPALPSQGPPVGLPSNSSPANAPPHTDLKAPSDLENQSGNKAAKDGNPLPSEKNPPLHNKGTASQEGTISKNSSNEKKPHENKDASNPSKLADQTLSKEKFPNPTAADIALKDSQDNSTSPVSGTSGDRIIVSPGRSGNENDFSGTGSLTGGIAAAVITIMGVSVLVIWN